MSEVKTLKEIALELLEKYRLAETSLIWRMSGLISEDITELESECNYIRKQIEKIAEPKKGEWIDEGWYANGFDHHAYCCSKCGEHYIKCPYEIIKFKYCPNCGAKMEATE